MEDTQIKLSGMVSDLLGVSGYRILRALARGESDVVKLAALADPRLRVSPQKLQEALHGQMHEQHRVLLQLFLERLDLVERQMTELAKVIGEAMRVHQQAITRLSLVPGLGIDSAHQMIAELGPEAAAFPSAPQCCSWVGVCPGRQESAGISESNRCPKGNPTMRRLLNQAAWAAAKTNDSHFQHLFRRLVPKLGIKKAIVAVAHHLLKVIWKILQITRNSEPWPATKGPVLAANRSSFGNSDVWAMPYRSAFPRSVFRECLRNARAGGRQDRPPHSHGPPACHCIWRTSVGLLASALGASRRGIRRPFGRQGFGREWIGRERCGHWRGRRRPGQHLIEQRGLLQILLRRRNLLIAIVVIAIAGAAPHLGRLRGDQRYDGMIREPAAFHAVIVEDVAQPKITHTKW